MNACMCVFMRSVLSVPYRIAFDVPAVPGEVDWWFEVCDKALPAVFWDDLCLTRGLLGSCRFVVVVVVDILLKQQQQKKKQKKQETNK